MRESECVYVCVCVCVIHTHSHTHKVYVCESVCVRERVCVSSSSSNAIWRRPSFKQKLLSCAEPAGHQRAYPSEMCPLAMFST